MKDNPYEQDDGMPQIIDKNTFEVVQNILKNRKHISPSNVKEQYLLIGKIFCGECGEPFIGVQVQKPDKKHFIINAKNKRLIIEMDEKN